MFNKFVVSIIFTTILAASCGPAGEMGTVLTQMLSPTATLFAATATITPPLGSRLNKPATLYTGLGNADFDITARLEAAAFFAVAKFRGVKLGYILYGGDDLSGVAWDSRKWHTRLDIRRNLVDISLRTCLSLG